MKRIVLLAAVVILAAALSGQSTNPHGTDQECGAVVKVECACPRIVHKIQQFEQKKCWDRSLDRDKFRQCMADAYLKTQHCNVMKNGHAVSEWDQFVREKGVLKLCHSQCHHRRCRCPDTGCHMMDEKSGYRP